MQRQFVQPDDVAVPFRHAIKLNHWFHLSRSKVFTRFVKVNTDSSNTPTRTPPDQYQGNCQTMRSASSRSLAGLLSAGLGFPRENRFMAGPNAARCRSTARPRVTQAASVF